MDNVLLATIGTLLSVISGLLGQIKDSEYPLPSNDIGGSYVFSSQSGGTIPSGMGIGVGTTTAGAAFAVATSSAGLNTAMLLSNLGSGYTFWAEDSANDTTPFVIDATGNVGIGTTSPTTLFGIQGVGNFVNAATSTVYNAFRTNKLEATSTVIMSGLAIESGIGNVLCVTATGQIVQDDSPITACSGASTEKIKMNINSLDEFSVIENLLKMRPVSYQYKPEYSKDDSIHFGFIAEEIAKIDPRLVEYQNGEPSGVKYAEMISALVKAIQIQQREIEELKAQINKSWW